jgi:O-antigen/teichoic acid export membrane protein
LKTVTPRARLASLRRTLTIDARGSAPTGLRSRLVQALSSPKHLVMLSSAAGQAVAFACTPLLSRLYSPADFGAFVLFSTLFNLLNIALSGRYEQAVYYARRARDASSVATLAVLLASAAALVFAGLLELIALAARRPELRAVAPLVAISALASVLVRVASLLIVRWKKLRALSAINFLKPSAVGLVQVACGLVAASTGALAVGHALANTLVLGFAWLRVPTLRRFLRPLPRTELAALLREHRAFPLYNVPQNLLFVLSDASVPLLAAERFGAAEAGLYWFAARLTSAPMQVFVESIRVVISDQLVRTVQRREPSAAWAVRTALGLAAPFLAAALLLSFAGPPLFELLFGPTWRGAGSLAALLFAYAAVNAAGVPLIAALPLTGLQRAHLVAEALVLVAKAAILVLAAGHATFFDTVALCIAAALLGYCIFYAIIWQRLRGLDARALHGS